MHVHYTDSNGTEIDRGSSWSGPDFSAGFHTFGIDWRPRRLTWLVDGVPRWQVSGAAVPNERMYLIANLAVGGTWVGRPRSSTRFPRAFQIDYVKAWR
jgi:beta-glucanase (GH16 family)